MYALQQATLLVSCCEVRPSGDLVRDSMYDGQACMRSTVADRTDVPGHDNQHKAGHKQHFSN